MLYVPNLDNYECVVILNSDTIRAYKEQPRLNSNIDYDDYYFNSHYISQYGTQRFTQYTNLPSCIDSSNLTNEFYYRNDISDIFICILFIMILLTIPFKILFRLFRRLN